MAKLNSFEIGSDARKSVVVSLCTAELEKGMWGKWHWRLKWLKCFMWVATRVIGGVKFET